MKKETAFTIILLLMITTGTYILLFGGEQSILGDPLEATGIKERNPEKDNSKNMRDLIPEQTQTNTQGSGSGGGSSGGSGGGGGSPGNTGGGTQCSNQPVSYSLGFFEQEETCTTYTGPTCIDKTVNCSVEVSNFDPVTTGTFEMEFEYYYNNNTERITLGSLIESANIQAQESETIYSAAGFSGTAANEEIRCLIKPYTIPLAC